MAELVITITGNEPWIRVSPEQVKSNAPDGISLDEQEVMIQVDHTLLRSVGTHKGKVKLTAPGAKPVTIKISVSNDSVVPVGGLSLVNTATNYSVPHLVEFFFSLRDKDDRAVVGEPNQFVVSAYEDGAEVGSMHGLAMKRGASRQLWLEMVLDYSIAMQQVEGGIAEMEYAATDILLDSLNTDALVGISEFHRDDQESTVVIPFNVDRDATAASIRDIQQTHVRGFASGARMYDALLSAIQRFGEGPDDSGAVRYIVLFSNGVDTSSTFFSAQVIERALEHRVHIIVVGFGEAIDSGSLLSMASLTGGNYMSAEKVEDLQPAFERIAEDLQGEYIIRWASLRRDSSTVYPGFTVAFGPSNVSYTATQPFRPTNFTGDPLAGRLILVQSDTAENTTVFLRANYMPRGIRKIACWISSPYAFDASLVDTADDGLLGAWALTQEEVVEEGGVWVTAESMGTDDYVSFAALGPMIRFTFSQRAEEPFTEFIIDNTIYTEGQTLNIEE